MTNELASVAHQVDVQVFLPANITAPGRILPFLQLESLRVSPGYITSARYPTSPILLFFLCLVLMMMMRRTTTTAMVAILAISTIYPDKLMNLISL